jgi:sugar phosphate isomerase/epimerase
LGRPIGIQLYTLRDLTAGDFAATVRQVAELGYDGVEFAGYFGLRGAAMRDLLADCGLKPAGTHVSLTALKENLDGEIGYALEVGYRYIALASTPPAVRATKEDCLRFAAWMDQVGAACRAEGLAFLYHNHDYEFQTFDGQYVLDLLMAGSDPAHVQMELDCYWAAQMGIDLPAYITRYAGRLPVLHCKDRTAPPDSTFAEVGEGIIDWAPVLAAADAAGCEWYVVEQDRCRRPPLESAAISLRNLRGALRRLEAPSL